MIPRPIIVRIHGASAILALATMIVFFASSLFSEIAGDAGVLAAVKGAIAWGLLLLVPAIATAGATGMRLAGPRPAGRSARKFARMPVIAANGLVVLAPAALFLAAKAKAGEIDLWFATVQAAEYLAGATNILLMSLNVRDGLAMSGKRRKAAGLRSALPQGSSSVSQ